MNTGSHRHQRHQAQNIDIVWVLLCAVFALALGLIALPWIIIGFLAERILTRWLHWKLCFLLWSVLFFVSAFVLYNSYQHGLQLMIAHELTDYILVAKHYQTDFSHWPLHALWSETLPIWLRTWQSIGIAGFGAELFIQPHKDTAKTLQINERHRKEHAQRSQQRAKRRTSRPTHMPAEVGDMMVIGVPIHDDTEEA